MAFYSPRNIGPADQVLFDADGNAVGIQPAASSSPPVLGFNPTKHAAIDSLVSQDGKSADVVVYGGTPAGIMAAIAAAREGVSVLLIAPTGRLGGMVTGGLARTDYRGYNPRTCMNVITAEFYRRCAAHYGMSLAQFGMDGTSPFATEPKVAMAAYKDMLREYGVPIIYNWRVTAVNKQAGDIKYIDLQGYRSPGETRRVFGRVFIDASYECDLLVRAGVSYKAGREANAQYSETYNGVTASAALTGSPSPYIIAGNSGSGLLPYVESAALETAGTADSRIMAFCHRLVMTNEASNRNPIPEPRTYNPLWYELLGRAMANAPTSLDSLDELFYRAAIPLGGTKKQDWNNNGAMSLNFVGGNLNFNTLDYAARDVIVQQHEDYTLGLFKFLREDSRVPSAARSALAEWGFCKDEFTDENSTGMSPELYVRESVRMVGDYVMTEANWAKSTTVANPIALCTYPMDSHTVSKRVVSNVAHVEGGLSSSLVPVGYYGVEYRAMLPKAQQCGNLAVCCNGISASHTVYGSIRMEVTFMSMGEAAGVAAALSLKGRSRLHDLAGSDLQPQIRPYTINTSRILTVNAPTTNGTVTLSSTPPSGWGYVTFPPEFHDVRMVNEGNGNKGGRWVRFNPTFAAAGRYRILLNAPGTTNAQLQCKIEVQSAAGAGAIDTFYIDHKFGEWHFRELGVWNMLNDGSCFIRITNGADPADPDQANLQNGLMSVDAVAWHPVP